MTALTVNMSGFVAAGLNATLTDGARGDGQDRGTPGTAQFSAGRYPACNKHGAMNALGGNVWRCLHPGCNVGVKVRWDKACGDWVVA